MHCSHQRGKGVWVRNLQPMGFTLILLLAPVVRSNKWKCATRNWYDSLFLLCKLTTCGRGNPMVMCAGEAHLREGCYHYAHHNTVAGTTKGENPALWSWHKLQGASSSGGRWPLVGTLSGHSLKGQCRSHREVASPALDLIRDREARSPAWSKLAGHQSCQHPSCARMLASFLNLARVLGHSPHPPLDK